MSQFWPPQPSDDGWQTITLNSPWSALGAPNRGAIARQRNGVVFVSIAATNSSGVAVNALIGTLPTACRPAAVVHAVMRSSGLVALVLYPNGDVQTATAIGSGVGIFGSAIFPLN